MTASIRVEHISKKYRIFDSFQKRVWEFLSPFRKPYHHPFWALQDISFEVPQGQTFGIIGRNGSGKSTLLQIIAGVLQPTSGVVTLDGKVSALLELGAGFNPHFTGRDNVLINGVIQGLNREEMEARLPQIIEFSELGDFVDQPVWTYSSGMYVRLAFAAAIHVDADILIVDEALAVGDSRFQRKCYQKFEQFRDAGKTILLVTHDAGAVVSHCDQAILLDNGHLLDKGKPKDIANQYIEILSGAVPHKRLPAPIPEVASSPTEPAEFAHVGEKPIETPDAATPLLHFLNEAHTDDRCAQRKTYNSNEHRYGNQQAEIIDYLIVHDDDYDPASLSTHDEVDIYLKVLFHQAVRKPIYGLTIKRVDGVEVYGNNSLYEEISVQSPEPGTTLVFKISVKLSLTQNNYFMSLGIANQEEDLEIVPLDRRYDLVHLQVHQRNRCFGIVDFDANFREFHIL